MDEHKSFEQLAAENASCSEFAYYGYIRIYQEGEKRCDCAQCKSLDEFNDNMNKHVTRTYFEF